jgi:hypothetical protein
VRTATWCGSICSWTSGFPIVIVARKRRDVVNPSTSQVDAYFPEGGLIEWPIPVGSANVTLRIDVQIRVSLEFTSASTRDVEAVTRATATSSLRRVRVLMRVKRTSPSRRDWFLLSCVQPVKNARSQQKNRSCGLSMCDGVLYLPSSLASDWSCERTGYWLFAKSGWTCTSNRAEPPIVETPCP